MRECCLLPIRSREVGRLLGVGAGWRRKCSAGGRSRSPNPTLAPASWTSGDTQQKQPTATAPSNPRLRPSCACREHILDSPHCRRALLKVRPLYVALLIPISCPPPAPDNMPRCVQLPPTPRPPGCGRTPACLWPTSTPTPSAASHCTHLCLRMAPCFPKPNTRSGNASWPLD